MEKKEVKSSQWVTFIRIKFASVVLIWQKEEHFTNVFATLTANNNRTVRKLKHS